MSPKLTAGPSQRFGSQWPCNERSEASWKSPSLAWWPLVRRHTQSQNGDSISEAKLCLPHLTCPGVVPEPQTTLLVTGAPKFFFGLKSSFSSFSSECTDASHCPLPPSAVHPVTHPVTDSLACGFPHHPCLGKPCNHLAFWHSVATIDPGFPLSAGLSPGPMGQFPCAPAPPPLWDLTAPEARTPARISATFRRKEKPSRESSHSQPPNLYPLPPSLPQLSPPGTMEDTPPPHPPHDGKVPKLQMASPCPSWIVSLPLFWVLLVTFQRT